MRVVADTFQGELAAHWQRVETGSGLLELDAGTLRLVNASPDARQYSNAQIDDYRHLARSRFPWRPPLTLTVRARFSHEQPAGTAGFGFWNEPFMTVGFRPPAFPQAIWFFHASPPSDMPLALDVPGWGWKAAMLDATRLPFPLLFPLGPLAIPFLRLPILYRRLWPLAQRLMHVAEAAIRSTMAGWHSYRIEWGVTTARFSVDDEVVLSASGPPQGPLGLVIWLDNRYLVATPQGRLRWGLLASPERQWLELGKVQVASLSMT